MKSTIQLSVIIPTFNGSTTIKETLDSILSQNNENVEVIISDDNSTDETLSICQSFIGKMDISIHKNSKNEGYSKNIKKGFSYSSGEFIFLLGQDDLVANRSFQLIKDLIKRYPQLTCISRPYFWFETNPFRIVRQKKRLFPKESNFLLINKNSSYRIISNLISTTDQLSGLVLKKSAVSSNFHEDVFTSHVYPFTSCFLAGESIMVPYSFIAVRIESSQSRNVSSIYEKSPIMSWKAWLDTFFPQSVYPEIHRYLIKHLIVNYGIGLLQIRNYSSKSIIYTLREILYMIKLRWKVIVDFRFLFMSILVIMVPKRLLQILVDAIKRYINRIMIKRNFESFTSLDIWQDSAIPNYFLDEMLSSDSQKKPQ